MLKALTNQTAEKVKYCSVSIKMSILLGNPLKSVRPACMHGGGAMKYVRVCIILCRLHLVRFIQKGLHPWHTESK